VEDVARFEGRALVGDAAKVTGIRHGQAPRAAAAGSQALTGDSAVVA
jgi:hypothetical protein